MERIIVFFAKKTMLVNIIVMAILFVGGYYYFNLRKESIPSTDLDMMLISVIYPGATPLDVEQNAVIPIEEQLQGISGIDEYETTIIENVAIILVTLDETLPDRQPVKDEIFRQMQNVPDLSTDVEEVTTYDLNPNKMSIYTLAVHFKEGMEGDERELFDVSQMLENELVRLDGVGEVRIEGRTDPEIKVYVDPIKMQKNYIALSDVVNALSIRNVRATGGDIETGGKEQTVVTYGEFQDPMEASNVIIRSTFNGQRVRVSDIARVVSGFEDKTTLMRVNRASGYSLSIVKNENADILKTIDVVNQYLKDNADLIPDNIQVSVMGDNSRTINSLLSIVASNLIQGFIIIFITLIIFLDFKSAMFTSLGMVVTMFSCFIYMQIAGITFNTMSLAAIITVLGMIVDNSIVVSENIFNFKQAGYKGLEATRLAVSDVVMPIVASTLTTVAAFFPMLTISGMMGKILNLFPKIVIFTLVVSMLQATLLLPNQLQDKEDKYKSYKPKKKGKFKNPLDFDKDALFDKMKIPFGAILEKLISVRYIVIGAFVALLIASVFLAQNSFKNFVLIYDTSADTIVINIEMPTGTTKEVTTKEIAKIEDVVASVVKPEELVALYSLVGKQVDQEVVSEEKGSLAGIMVYLVPAAERDRTADELVALINQEIDKTDIRQTVPIFSMNTKGNIDPGDPVDIKIVGNNTELAKKAKDEIKEFLATVPGVINIDDELGSKTMLEHTHCNLITYGIKRKDAALKAENVEIKASGASFDVEYNNEAIHFDLKVTGMFNVYNILGVIGAALAEHIAPAVIRETLENFEAVAGRFELVRQGQDFSVIVDYAHTPDGLENVLKTAREIAKKRLIVVFGCGGDRDRTKRPIMGRIAAQLADVVIATSDNPRTEDPEFILSQVEEGVLPALHGNFHEKITDRRQAIFRAVELAQKDDIVLIAGKGHENYQILKTGTIHFDDKEVAIEAIRRKLNG